MPCPSLPTELLTQIICEAAIELPEGDTYQRNKDLRSFSLVSSQWRAIAQAELIRLPTVGTLQRIRQLTHKISVEPRLQRRMKHLRFLPQGNDEGPLETALSEALFALKVDLESVSICYRNVYQRKSLWLWMYWWTCSHLTSLAISHAELQVPTEDSWREILFPNFKTLDLRRVIITTDDDDHYLWKLNNRASEIVLPLGDRATTPALRTLRISASGYGSLNIGDFVDLADQITNLSLGVFSDHGFLEPELLEKFTALQTFEVDWPLDKDVPFWQLKASGSPLKELRVRDRHDRHLEENGWDEIDGTEEIMHIEWSPEREGHGGEIKRRASEPEEQETEEEEEERLELEDEKRSEEDYCRFERIEHIAQRLCDSIEDFPELRTLDLPPKFATALAALDEYLDYYEAPRLAAQCEELGIEIKIEERRWETDLAYKQFANPARS